MWSQVEVRHRLDDRDLLLLNLPWSRSADSGERSNFEFILGWHRRASLNVAYRASVDVFVEQLDVESGQRRVGEKRLMLDYYRIWTRPREAALTSRLRADLRWIDGDPSQRLRERLRYDWVHSSGNFLVLPYVSGEAAYDTRFNALSFCRFELGSRVVLRRDVDITPYLAWQPILEPVRRNEVGLGLTVGWNV
jgi:hypothetical protein